MGDSVIRLTDLTPGTHLAGLVPNSVVKVVAVTPIGEACNVVYELPDGRITQEIVDQATLANLSIVTASEAPSRFDADPEEFRLAAEALRIKYAAQYDPMSAVYSSNIDPLPHQIRAVYSDMLPKVPLRFLLADDPGAGKTIMAGLYVKEMLLRSAAERIVIICPGGLADQWRDELQSKFDLDFEVFDPSMCDASPTGNPFRDHSRLICRMDQIARNDDLKAMLDDVEWDIAIVDEAHRMSAHYRSQYGEIDRSKRYQLGETLSRTSENLLLMTATPHSGKEDDFQLFMALLDPDRFAGRVRSDAHRTNTEGLMRRMVKEDLLTFDGKPLFPERRAQTVSYQLSPGETQLYQAVTDYVRSGMGAADRLIQQGDSRRGSSVGFALTVLQRRLASSPEAILRSLERRHDRLAQRLRDIEEHPELLRQSERSVTTSQRVSSSYSMSAVDQGTLQWDADTFDEQWDETSEDRQAVLEAQRDEVVDAATAAQTREELAAEIHTLEDLTIEARHVRAADEDTKWHELRKILDDRVLESGTSAQPHKMIVFTEHRDTMNYLVQKITSLLGRQEVVVTIHGGMNRDERKAQQTRFINDPTTRILVATDAAGEGLNLQRANLMVNYDLPWNPNRIEQRFGRIHRIGQTQVCWLWNLLASNTREGDVYLALLKKIDQMNKTFHGNLFNVLGEQQAFKGKPLKDLMIEAIRYGDQPTVRAKLEQTIDVSVSNGLNALINERSAHPEMYPNLDVQEVRRMMERTRERKLQPGYIAAFFHAAFSKLNGAEREREQNRWELIHVPEVIRKRAERLNRHLQVPAAYERVTFDPHRTHIGGDKPDAALIAPGTPLLDAVTDMIIEQYSPVLDQGTVFVDRTDKQPQEPMLMMAAEQTITDSRSRIVSQHFDYVQLTNGHEPLLSPAPPYLDYDAPRESEHSRVRSMLESSWLHDDHTDTVRNWTYLHGTKSRLDELNARRQADTDRVRSQVQERLQAEIEYWYQQYNILKENERSGRKNKRMTASAAKSRAERYEERLQRREAELDQNLHLSPKPALIRGAALVIPEHVIAQEQYEATDPSVALSFARETKEVDERAVAKAMAAERSIGRTPCEMPHNNKGFDIRSIDTQGRVFFIEVKGRLSGRDQTFTVTKDEVAFAQSQGDRHRLALVIVSPDGNSDHDQLRYVSRAFDTISLSKSTRSYNENLKPYWQRGTEPL